MMRLGQWAVLLLALASSLAAQTETPSKPTLVLHHVTVIDGTGAPPLTNRTVLIAGNRILAITRTGKASLADGVQQVDGTGKFLIPGLWDMHVHLAGVSADPRWSRDTLLPLLIANGITGARDMGGDLDALTAWKKEIAAGKLLGPHLVVSGPMLYGGRQAGPDVRPVHDAAEARAAVDDLAAHGADFIKTLSRLSKEIFLAVAEESRAEHLPLAGHVPEALGAAGASSAGMTSIEHIFYSNLSLDCSSEETELRAKLLEAAGKHDAAGYNAALDRALETFSEEKAGGLWKTLLRNGTWVVPTLAAMFNNAHLDKASADNPGYAYLPGKLAAEWKPEQLAKENPPDRLRSFARQFENDKKILASMHRAGVRVMAGSDSLDIYHFPGASLHQELALLVEAGYTPLEALQAATRNPADFLGREKDLGSITQGKIADLVLLDANPLENIGNTRRIAAVVLGGKYLSRVDLDGLLAAARAAAKAAGN